MTPDESAGIVRRYYKEVWEGGNLSRLDALAAPDLVLNGWALGLDGLKSMIASQRQAFPDLKYTLEDVLGMGDKVVVRFTFYGTHLDTYRNITPTGRRVACSGIGIWRVAGGKLVEHWSNMDLYGLMQQLGAIPSQKSARAASTAKGVHHDLPAGPPQGGGLHKMEGCLR